MDYIINNYQNALTLKCSDLEKGIEENFGIKTFISKEENKLYIGITHYQSCFTLMTKLRWDFDYSVYKKGDLYIINIKNYSKIKMKKASNLFEFKSIEELSKDSFYNMQNYSQLIIDFIQDFEDIDTKEELSSISYRMDCVLEIIDKSRENDVNALKFLLKASKEVLEKYNQIKNK